MVEMEGHSTPLDYQRNLVDDPVRVTTYDRALRALIHPGDVVLDVGAGTGLLAMLAARAGAARVHAVESMPVAGLAADLVRHNGLEGRVVVHRADIRTMEPAEGVDLVVSDFMGRFVVDDEMLGAVAAAGAWMRPGARFCPSEVRLMLAPVADFAMRQVDRWQSPLLGLDLSPAASPALHSCFMGRLGRAQLLGEPRVYHVLEPPAPAGIFDHRLGLDITRPGLLRAVAGWFEADLAPGITLSTAPGTDTHWGQYLFPLPPTPVAAGQRLELRLRLDQGVWRWDTALGEHRWSQHSEIVHAAGLAASPPPPPHDPDATHAAARAHLVAGRHGAAEAAWLALVTHHPGHPAIRDFHAGLGLARCATQRWLDAVPELLRALDDQPLDHPDALRALIPALAMFGMHHELHRWLTLYEAHFGPHPDIQRQQ